MGDPPPLQSQFPKIDRQSTTPFHLKLFYRLNTFHRLEEFHPPPNTLPPHLQIYTWPSCTLAELSHLLTSALLSSNPTLLPDPLPGTRLAFRLVYPDTRYAGPGPRYAWKHLGSVIVSGNTGNFYENKNKDGDPKDEAQDGARFGKRGAVAGDEEEVDDSKKTLQEARFVIGDYISACILPPLPDGSVASPPPPPSVGNTLPPVSGSGGYGGYSRRGEYRGGGYNTRENGYGRGRQGGRGRYGSDVPVGEWKRGEKVPDPDVNTTRGSGGGGFGYGKGRGRGW